MATSCCARVASLVLLKPNTLNLVLFEIVWLQIFCLVVFQTSVFYSNFMWRRKKHEFFVPPARSVLYILKVTLVQNIAKTLLNYFCDVHLYFILFQQKILIFRIEKMFVLFWFFSVGVWLFSCENCLETLCCSSLESLCGNRGWKTALLYIVFFGLSYLCTYLIVSNMKVFSCHILLKFEHI